MLRSYDLNKGFEGLCSCNEDCVRITLYPTCLDIRIDINIQEKIKQSQVRGSEEQQCLLGLSTVFSNSP